MADLGNQKIKDTYQLVLQTDASGNLQKLDGTSPNPFIINQNLRYLDGTTHPSGYVLMSDGSGNASWGAVAFSGDVYISGGSIEGTTIELRTTSGNTVSIPGLKWSANTDGSISPSGLTTSVGIGTTTPNKPLTVVGDISGTTDLYLGDSVHTGSTIVAQEQLTIKGRGADNDYMVLKQDAIDFHIDGLQTVRFMPGVFDFNASGYDYDFKINGEDQLIFRVYGTSGEERVRIKDHLAIGGNEAISHTDSVKWGLAVTGSSLFYSGGTSMSGNAITAVGDISGTTDLYIGDNIYSGTTNLLDIFSNNSGTVTSVTGTAPVVSSGGNTPAISVTTQAVASDVTNLATGHQIYEYVAGAEAGSARAITVSESTDDTEFILTFVTDYEAAARVYAQENLTYNPLQRNLTSYQFTGNLVGNSSTSTKIASITNTNIVQLGETQTLTNKTLTTPVIGDMSSCTFPTLNQNTTGTSNNEDVYMFSNRGQGQTDITHWYGPNYQGVYNYSWSKDYGDDTEVLTLGKDYINAGILVPYDCVLTGFFTIGHSNTGDEGYSCGLWYITQSNLAPALNIVGESPDTATITLAGSGTTITPGTGADNKQPLTIDKIGTMSVALTQGSMIYPRVGDSAVVTDTTWNVYLKRT